MANPRTPTVPDSGDIRWEQTNLISNPDRDVLQMRLTDLELMLTKYRTEVTRPSLAGVAAWVAMVIATGPVFVADEFIVDFVFSTSTWEIILGTLFFVSIFMVVRGTLAALMTDVRHRLPRWLRRVLGLGQPSDWVPESPAEMAKDIFEQWRQASERPNPDTGDSGNPGAS